MSYKEHLLNAGAPRIYFQSETTFEIAPNATINKTASGTFPSETHDWKYSVSISSREKADTSWLVGRWRNANINNDDEWVFTATTYEYSGTEPYGSGTWTITSNNTILHLEKNGATQTFDKSFGVSNDKNTLYCGGETYNRVE